MIIEVQMLEKLLASQRNNFVEEIEGTMYQKKIYNSF